MRTRTPLIYHGTTKHYYREQLRTFGRYQHVPLEILKTTENRKRIYLENDPLIAMGFAAERSMDHGSHPILLIVKTELITPDTRLVWEPDLTCDFLEQKWYRIFNVKTTRGKVTERSLVGLEEAEKEVLSL